MKPHPKGGEPKKETRTGANVSRADFQWIPNAKSESAVGNHCVNKAQTRLTLSRRSRSLTGMKKIG